MSDDEPKKRLTDEQRSSLIAALALALQAQTATLEMLLRSTPDLARAKVKR